MAADEVAGRITGFIREELLDGDSRNELDMDTPLLEWGILNSLNTAKLLAFIRTDLGAFVPPLEINARNFRDVRSISALVLGLVER